MKTTYRKLLPALALGLALAGSLASCSDDPAYLLDGSSSGQGQVALGGLEVDVDEAESVISRAVATSNFRVVITDAQGNVKLSTTMANRPEIMTLPVADGYILTVDSHEQEAAAWSAPYYAGTATFNVAENAITDIGTVTARFANVRVTVNYSDELLDLLDGDASVSVNCSESGASLAFAHTETRSGYFRAATGSTTLGATFTGSVKGQAVSMVKALDNVAAGQHRIINFGVRKGNTDVPDEFGDVAIGGETTEGIKLGDGLYLDVTVSSVDVDGNLTVEENADSSAERPGKEEDPEQPDEPGEPEPGGETVTITSAGMSFTQEMDPNAVTDGRVDVTSENGVESLVVEIVTDSDNFRDALLDPSILGTTTFDLADVTDASLQAGLGDLGFPTNSDVKGKTAVSFDITDFVPLLAAFPGHHSFKITVTDANGDSLTKTLAFLAL